MERVEAKMDGVSQRLAAVEKSLSTVGGGDLKAFQEQMLVALRQLREAMVKDAATSAPAASSISNEAALREENEALKKQVEKLNYRVSHLLRHVAN
ncbi:hypothetical protein SPRG_12412 [Saprolegnia parasitica CBS 223.65]|uniref:Uncharacterized protein n=1 Tax=Saprolegnia parasitica (strain CBS 223.65) TaxID=695850 RepID=A0A067BX31_SAPPC|nr:hypothetical protein SPRG_12412 [Saprolegnia parasitica CBS 223.65]KDO21405.1 hypothetical protein SPRG_12412 [Saprolegnia parasitica CBS 223.65]|eukprot:XP_012207852.1 hypothetical protein SPRG_12412 [Saprolegnia parasitica CBS 223.65]